MKRIEKKKIYELPSFLNAGAAADFLYTFRDSSSGLVFVRAEDEQFSRNLRSLDSDLPAIFLACRAGTLTPELVRWSPKSAVCVVIAAPGYPGSYPKGMPITGIEAAEAAGNGAVKVFQAGTKLDGGRLVTSGGRVLGVTALGEDLAAAQAAAYRAAEKVHFEGAFYRRDIGDKGRKREGK